MLVLCKCYGLTTMNHLLSSWFASIRPHLREALFKVWAMASVPVTALSRLLKWDQRSKHRLCELNLSVEIWACVREIDPCRFLCVRMGIIPRICCDGCFCVKGYRLVFAVNCLLFEVFCFLNKNINQIQLVTESSLDFSKCGCPLLQNYLYF